MTKHIQPPKKKINMKKILFICALVMTLTTAHSQNRQIVVDKVNDNVRIIEAQGTCIGGFTATKLLFIAMQTYVSPQDTVHKIITNVKNI